MILAQKLATDSQRPLEMRPRPGQVAHVLKDTAEVVEVARHVRMVWAKGHLVQPQRPLVMRPRPGQGYTAKLSVTSLDRLGDGLPGMLETVAV
jgi:hypothetical protein